MKVFQCILLVMFFASVKAQSVSSYQNDLAELRQVLQKTPSYKDQITGKNENSYNNLYEKLLADTVNNISDYKYFYNLAQLFFPIRDNHLGFYQIANFPSSDYFPMFKGDVDSLRSVLTNKPADSLEGIYYYDKYYSVGLIKATKTDYIGVILDSEVSNWKKGQIAIYLYEYLPDLFKAIYAHPKFKNYIFYPVERLTNHSLTNSYFYLSFSEKVYSKNVDEYDFINLPKNREDFSLKTVATGIQYIQLKHFSADQTLMQKSKEFYDSIKNLLKEPNLIVDLRNNEGGATKVSEKYIDLIRQYSRKGHVYVLVNNGTMSQGEIFTLQIKEMPNVKTLGKTTKGMLTYGSNYGKRVKLPSQAFEVYITDMKGSKKHLPYENYGINPDIILSDNKDWVEQTIEIISKK